MNVYLLIHPTRKKQIQFSSKLIKLKYDVNLQ